MVRSLEEFKGPHSFIVMAFGQSVKNNPHLLPYTFFVINIRCVGIFWFIFRLFGDIKMIHGYMYYLHVGNNTYTHYTSKDITKQYGKSKNY